MQSAGDITIGLRFKHLKFACDGAGRFQKHAAVLCWQRLIVVDNDERRRKIVTPGW
jgi:hypothetical protein